jgi:biotin carboxylase
VRVLVLGTNRICHERLHEQGHELVLLVPRGRARPGDVTGPYRHVAVLADDASPAMWVEVARAVHAESPVGAVAAYNEHTYPEVTAVAGALGVPTVVDLELYHRVLDKSLTRRVLDRHGVPGCRFEVAHDAGKAAAAVEQIGFPCILKPLDGEASEGVSKLTSAADLAPALDGIRPSAVGRGVLVEEFLTGPEFSVEAISVGRRHRIVAVTQKYADPATFVERGHLVPAPLPEDTHRAVVDYVVRVLDALGFHDCPSHTELKLTPEGPRLIETHNRIGGDRIVDLVALATGVDLYDLVARQSIGEDVTSRLPDELPALASAAVWYAAPRSGPGDVLAEVAGVEAARELRGVQAVEVLRPPGSRGGPVAKSGDRWALALAVGSGPDEAVGRARAAIGGLTFRYAPGA